MAAVPCPDSTGTAGEVKKIFLTPFLPCSFGSLDISTVVNSVFVGDDRLVVAWDASMQFSLPDGTVLDLVGGIQEIHVFVPPDTVSLSTSFDLASDYVDGEMLIIDIDYVATLVR